jgi:ABC-type transporter Mla subunit MlaD
MSTPFKLRFANEIAGLFVLSIVFLTVGTLFIMAHSQQWFETSRRYTVPLPEDGAYGLQEGAQVQYLGTVVGMVEEISVNPSGMAARFSVRRGFDELVREDTEVTLRRMWEVAGDTVLDISSSDGSPLPEGQVLKQATFDVGLMDIVRTSLHEEILPTLREIRAAAEQAKLLATDLRQKTAPVGPLLSRVDEFVDSLQHGDGILQLILRDGALAAEVRDSVMLFQKLAERLTNITTSVHLAAEQLPGISKALRLELDDLPGSVLQLRSLLNEAEKLIEGVQRHWLLKSYMDPSGQELRLRPSEALGPSGGGGRQ